MQLGIIGLPQSGKTTLYKALTRSDVPTEISSGRMQVHTAVVDVPDPRVDDMVAIYKPKKVVHTKVTYADIAGLDASGNKEGLSGALINQLGQMDGFRMLPASLRMLPYRTKRGALTPCATYSEWIRNLSSMT